LGASFHRLGKLASQPSAGASMCSPGKALSTLTFRTTSRPSTPPASTSLMGAAIATSFCPMVHRCQPFCLVAVTLMAHKVAEYHAQTIVQKYGAEHHASITQKTTQGYQPRCILSGYGSRSCQHTFLGRTIFCSAISSCCSSLTTSLTPDSWSHRPGNKVNTARMINIAPRMPPPATPCTQSG
jgi:hypothetical protein